MADIKTHLRELSVGIGIATNLNNESIEKLDLFNINNFLTYAKNIYTNDIEPANNLRKISNISGEYLSIFYNGIKLGQYIVEKFHLDSLIYLEWTGSDTQKDDPTDLIVNNLRFSLKEDSFILENMGLYKLLSLLTTNNYTRGIHVFADFATQEYNKWFLYTWRAFIDYLCKNKKWIAESKGNKSIAEINGQSIELTYNEQKISLPKNIISINTYIQLTNSTFREKIFSKWINEYFSNDSCYLKLKKECALEAGKEICRLITNNLDISGLKRFLQIRDFEYFYAKSTIDETIILRVPSSKNFLSEIEITSVTYSVPESQLNLLTEITNKKTKQSLTLRNECRFSHGQLNGTPEAKMYYKGNLFTIYEEI